MTSLPILFSNETTEVRSVLLNAPTRMSAIRSLYRRFSNRHVTMSGLSRERLAMTGTTVALTASRTRHTTTMKTCQTRVLYRSDLSLVSEPIRTLVENEYCATRHHGRHTWYVGPSRAGSRERRLNQPVTGSPTCRRLAPDFALFPTGYRVL